MQVEASTNAPSVSSLRNQFDKTAQNHATDQSHMHKHVGTNVNRLRSVYNEISSEKRQKLNDFEHLSRFSKIEETTKLVVKSAKSDNQRSRSLSTPRLSGTHTYNASPEDSNECQSSKETLKQPNSKQTSIFASDALTKTSTDHVSRFQSAKALFARIEEEAKLAKQQQLLQQRNLKAFSRLSINFLSQPSTSPPTSSDQYALVKQNSGPTLTSTQSDPQIKRKSSPFQDHLAFEDNKENEHFAFRKSSEGESDQPKRNSWVKSKSNPTSPTKAYPPVSTLNNNDLIISPSSINASPKNNAISKNLNAGMANEQESPLQSPGSSPNTITESKTPPPTPYNVNGDLIKHHQFTFNDVSNQIVANSIANSRRNLFGKQSS
jgi:hypothetical protein